MESFPYWKNIYQTLVMKQKSVKLDFVDVVIKSAKKELFEGLLVYKPYTKASYDLWKSKVAIKDHQIFESFIQDMSRVNNLDCQVTYTIFCNFIMFEYYGRLDDVANAAAADYFKEMFYKRVYDFIRAERSFHIKTVQYIIKEHRNPGHRLHKPFNNFVAEYKIEAIRDELKKQIVMLLNEPMDNLHFQSEGVSRNKIEVMEILITYIYTLENDVLEVEELVDLLTLFNDYGFAAYNMDASHELDIRILQYAVLIVALKDYWSSKKWHSKYKLLETIFLDHIGTLGCNPLLLLCWSLLSIPIPLDHLNHEFSRYRAFALGSALNPRAFSQLFFVLTKCGLKGTKLEQLLKQGAYNLLSEFCSRIENVQKVCDKTFKIGETLAIIMEDPKVCDEVCSDSCPVSKFIKTALNFFPYNFSAFCALMKSLVRNPMQSKNAVNLLFNISVYTEESYHRIENDFNKTMANYLPIDGMEIPAGASVTLLDLTPKKQLVQFEGNFVYPFLVYFDAVMTKIVDYFASSARPKPEYEDCIELTIIGFDLLMATLEMDKRMWAAQRNFQILFHSMSILSNVQIGQYKSWRLIDKILNFFIVAVRAEGRAATPLFLNSKCFPAPPKNYTKISALCQFNQYNDCHFLLVVMHECSLGNYTLLITLIKFICDAFQHQLENEKILIPGMLFILNNVFPYHLNWQESGINEKNAVTKGILALLLEALQTSVNSEDEHLKLVYEICIESILNNVAFAKTFIAVIRYKNDFIEGLMLNELDWIDGKALEIIRSVRIALSIVVFLYSHVNYETLKRTMFWKYFAYTGVNFPSILRIICEYINHKYDSGLPALACILFRKICTDPNMPVLASLELDEYQVQVMFLERLRDPLVDDDMRILLLELITTCVEKQNGMTAALFSLQKRKDGNTDTEEISDNIITYMGDYLKAVAHEPECYQSPVQVKILRLFHTLWIRKRTILINELIHKKNFWEVIMHPLSNITVPVASENYCRILDIVAIELSFCSMSKELEKELKKIFDPQRETLKGLLKIIFSSVRAADAKTVKPHSIDILYTWKKFLVFVLKHHGHVAEMNTRQILITSTMEGLLEHLEDPRNMRVISNWIELYMVITDNCQREDFNSATNFESLILIFKRLEPMFLELPRNTKDALITIAINSVDHFDDLFRTNSVLAREFLDVVKSLIEMQYDYWLSIRDGKQISYLDHVVWMLMITFCNKLLKNEMNHKWIFYAQLVSKAMHTLGYFCSSRRTMPIAKLCAQFLYNCACTSLYKDFTGLNFTHIYDTVAPPKDLLHFDGVVKTGSNADLYVELWQTYYFIFRVKAKLLEKLGHVIFKPIMEFLYMQRNEIMSILKLPEVTAHPAALRVVCSYLDLYIGLVKWKSVWFVFDEANFGTYYNLLPRLCYACLNIALSPRVMKFYAPSDNFKYNLLESIPLNYLGDIMDRILEIMGKICYVCYLTSPNLFDLLTKPIQTTNVQYAFTLYWDFHTPDYYNKKENLQHLTFGALLSFLHFLCKTKHQQLKEQPPKSTMLFLSNFTFGRVQKETSKAELMQYTSCICPEFLDDIGPDRISPLQRLPTSDIYNLSSPWLAAINREILNTTFEIVGTLLASQVYKYVCCPSVNPQVLAQSQLLKRELCPELQFFNEFVHKKLTDSQRYYIDGNATVCIKKTAEKRYETSEYLLMLSNWFLQVCELAP